MGIKAGKAVLDCLFEALYPPQGSQVLVMPLSKTRDRERKRLSRLDKRLSTPYQSKCVQPKPLDIPDNSPNIAYIDADGSPVYDVP